jgi:hypothetical protein
MRYRFDEDLCGVTKKLYLKHISTKIMVNVNWALASNIVGLIWSFIMPAYPLRL